jgi:hypothetical protein
LCLIGLGIASLVVFAPEQTIIPATAIVQSTSNPTPIITFTPSHDYGQLVDIPPLRTLNAGLTYATPDYVSSILGPPGDMTDTCSAVTNPKLSRLIVTQDVGPNTVTGLKPAVEALQRIYAAVERDHPDLYAQLAGQEIPLKDEAMLCVRKVAGLFPANYSLHAWGIAVDIAINSTLDNLGDKKTQEGLLILYPYFHAEGFYWGAAFSPTEDAMHFEVSRQLLNSWKNQGLFDSP